MINTERLSCFELRILIENKKKELIELEKKIKEKRDMEKKRKCNKISLEHYAHIFFMIEDQKFSIKNFSKLDKNTQIAMIEDKINDLSLEKVPSYSNSVSSEDVKKKNLLLLMSWGLRLIKLKKNTAPEAHNIFSELRTKIKCDQPFVKDFESNFGAIL